MKGRTRPVAPLAVPMSSVEIECEGLFVVLRHLADGRTTDDAWALGKIDAGDLRTASACAVRPPHVGPVVTAAQIEAAVERDRARVRAELRDRLDHAHEVGVDFEAVLRAVAHTQPDAVRAALDEAGAPT